MMSRTDDMEFRDSKSDGFHESKSFCVLSEDGLIDCNTQFPKRTLSAKYDRAGVPNEID